MKKKATIVISKDEINILSLGVIDQIEKNDGLADEARRQGYDKLAERAAELAEQAEHLYSKLIAAGKDIELQEQYAAKQAAEKGV